MWYLLTIGVIAVTALLIVTVVYGHASIEEAIWGFGKLVFVFIVFISICVIGLHVFESKQMNKASAEVMARTLGFDVISVQAYNTRNLFSGSMHMNIDEIKTKESFEFIKDDEKYKLDMICIDVGDNGTIFYFKYKGRYIEGKFPYREEQRKQFFSQLKKPDAFKKILDKNGVAYD